MIGHELSKAIIRYNEIYRAQKAPLTLPQVIVMKEMVRETTVTDLALEGDTGFDKSTINSLMHRIKKRGFIERTSSGRPKRSRLTPAGRGALFSSLNALEKTDEEFLSSVAKADRPTFSFLLKTIAKSVPSRSPELCD